MLVLFYSAFYFDVQDLVSSKWMYANDPRPPCSIFYAMDVTIALYASSILGASWARSGTHMLTVSAQCRRGLNVRSHWVENVGR